MKSSSFELDLDPLMMKETDPEVIDSQIAAGISSEQGSAFRFLNNFETLILGGFQRNLVESMHMLDEPIGCDELTIELHSENYRQATYRSFFDDVDRALEAPEIDPAVLAQLREDYNDDSGKHDRSTAQELITRYALPVYRQLRIQGYSHYDLWR